MRARLAQPTEPPGPVTGVDAHGVLSRSSLTCSATLKFARSLPVDLRRKTSGGLPTDPAAVRDLTRASPPDVRHATRWPCILWCVRATLTTTPPTRGRPPNSPRPSGRCAFLQAGRSSSHAGVMNRLDARLLVVRPLRRTLTGEDAAKNESGPRTRGTGGSARARPRLASGSNPAPGPVPARRRLRLRPLPGRLGSMRTAPRAF